MPVRSTMTALISEARTLTGDAGSPPQWSDQQVQDALDRRRQAVRYAPLRPQPTFGPGGVLTYSDYFADAGNWEAGETLTDAAWNVITPASADEITGHWTFSTPSPGQLPPVHVTGYVYDLYGGAADLLEKWAAAVALKFAFTVNQDTYHPEQQRAALLGIAAEYRSKQWPSHTTIFRSDDRTDQGFGMTAWYDDPRNL